jgi:hypothetical protein
VHIRVATQQLDKFGGRDRKVELASNSDRHRVCRLLECDADIRKFERPSTTRVRPATVTYDPINEVTITEPHVVDFNE